MPSKPTLANELKQLIAQQGLEPFLETTRVSVALLSSDGDLISSNPAFEDLKQISPNANTFREIVASVARTEFDRLLRVVMHDHKLIQSDLDFDLENQPRRYSCLFIPLEDGRVLFFGEPALTSFDPPENYQRLMQNFQRVNAELKENSAGFGKKANGIGGCDCPSERGVAYRFPDLAR